MRNFFQMKRFISSFLNEKKSCVRYIIRNWPDCTTLFFGITFVECLFRLESAESALIVPRQVLVYPLLM